MEHVCPFYINDNLNHLPSKLQQFQPINGLRFTMSRKMKWLLEVHLLLLQNYIFPS